MSLARVVILISGSGTNMVNLTEACQEGQIPGEVVAVISNKPDAKGLDKAAQLGINTEVLSHKEYATREDYDQALTQLIDSYQPDVIVLAGFMRILTADLVRHFSGKMLNIHPSLLPKYKGLNTHQRALDAGDDIHGVSVHFVSEELDGGPVVLQAQIPIFAGDTVEDLQERVHEQEYRIYPLVLKWVCEGRLKLTEQGAHLDGTLLGPQGYAAD
ncbi:MULTISPECIES: phosphoribosylglycinamide formyltransferase [Gammaproteobacteria]|uniref:phosphoribosylglycinamide formyltransferase n=1 Tax=Gammaproteobacteria TaxID=1236 RepID=UPI000DD0BC7B|nr:MULTISPECIES: phosphoribosylglycinamide formyltransferase [Gammaproteobacteria]RTE87487.1 phosphoribosylglycinamide formyltransferase [Aliidiomarina sp. B3213]TCZ92728.1 phosphoribosylglycinamide formyltransferase [Lysobacter sp. N42]